MPTRRGCLIEPGTLGGKDARELVQHRWRTWLDNTEVESPFDLTGVEEYFTTHTSSVKRVLVLVGKVLQQKIADDKEDEPWPTARDELFVTAPELRNRIDALLDFISNIRPEEVLG